MRFIIRTYSGVNGKLWKPFFLMLAVRSVGNCARKAVATKWGVGDGSLAFSLLDHHKRLCKNPHERWKCQEVEREAWAFLQQVSDEKIEDFSAFEVAELLSSWVYFSKFWENGMNGPFVASSIGPSSLPLQRDPSLLVPLAKRDPIHERKHHVEDRIALPPRANPLDEVILEF